MSLSAGAARLAGLCEAIERASKAGQTDIPERIADVGPLARSTCDMMGQRLSARATAKAV
ncbi:hypothetical protein D3C83_324140 [compost metagenome]